MLFHGKTASTVNSTWCNEHIHCSQS